MIYRPSITDVAKLLSSFKSWHHRLHRLSWANLQRFDKAEKIDKSKMKSDKALLYSSVKFVFKQSKKEDFHAS